MPHTPYAAESLSCQQCSRSIVACEAFVIDEYATAYLPPSGLAHSMSWKSSAKCIACGFPQMLQNNQDIESMIRSIVSDELEKIFKREIADPDGRFGPNGLKV